MIPPFLELRQHIILDVLHSYDLEGIIKTSLHGLFDDICWKVASARYDEGFHLDLLLLNQLVDFDLILFTKLVVDVEFWRDWSDEGTRVVAAHK